MPLSTNHVGFWPAAAATVPGNWTEDAAYQDRYLQGVADVTGAGGTAPANGGAATHLHTTSHTHTGDAHTHTFSGSLVNPAGGAGCGFDYLGVVCSGYNHSHGNATSNAATITYQNDTTSTSAVAMQPPYLRVVAMSPDDALQEYPDDALAFADTDAPTGYSLADGNGGTVNAVDRWLIGREAAGEDGGIAGGAATHAQAQANHSHTPDDHGHVEKRCANSDIFTRRLAGVNETPYKRDHHDVELMLEPLADVSTDATVVNDAASEPAYAKLLGIQNTSGGASTPEGLILGWKGTAASIPSDWSLCDGTNGTPDLTGTQVKATATVGDIAATGGSNTHPHAVDAHGHTHGVHNHGFYSVVNVNTTGTTSGALATLSATSTKDGHTWTIGNTRPTMQNTGFNTDLADGRYLWRELLWIKYTPPPTVWIKGGTWIKGAAEIAA